MKRLIGKWAAAACLALGMLGASPAWGKGDYYSVKTWTSLKKCLENGDSVMLANDITQDGEQVELEGDQQVFVNVNGHTLTATRRLFWVNSAKVKLQFFDWNGGGKGRIVSNGKLFGGPGPCACVLYGNIELNTVTIDGFNVSSASHGGGGAIKVTLGGTFTMNSGTIKNCQSELTAGAVHCLGGTFVMNGGTISGCSAAKGGGAVYVTSYSSEGGYPAVFTMNGGTIESCTQTGTMNGGGAVFVSAITGFSTTVNINGGTIKNCSANTYGGAFYVKQKTYSKVYIYGGYFSNVSAANGYGFCYGVDSATVELHGGVYYNFNPTSNNHAGVYYGSVAAVGANYVVGKNVTTSGSMLKSGSFKFNPTTYGVSIYSKSKFSGSGSGSSALYTVTGPIAVPIPAVAYAHVSGIKVGTAMEPVATPVDVPVDGSITVTYAADDGYLLTGDKTAGLTGVTAKNKTIDVSKVTVGALTPIGGNVGVCVTNGTCWVAGSGDMPDYAKAGQSPLWAKSREIRSVVIEEGVTGVGSHTFDKFYNLTNVTVAASVTNVGEAAFLRCLSLEKLAFEAEQKDITFGKNAYVIHAGIKMEGGVPVVYPVPEVTFAGKPPALYGKAALTDDEWAEVTDENKGGFHFFTFEPPVAQEQK